MKNSILALLVLVFIISGCSENQSNIEKPTVKGATEKTPIGEEVYEKAEEIFYSLPSPVEMTTLIKTGGGEFRKDLILDPNRANDFQTLQKQAFALGVYGADLSYTGLFEQQQEAIKLLAAAKRVASKVGVEDVYSADFVERANRNLGNRDSIMGILTEVYWETNSELKENNRNELAMLILGAGWIEGVYLGCELIDTQKEDDEIAHRLIEQKLTALQLQELFKKYANNEIVASSYEIFAPLLDVFASFDLTITSSNITRDETSGNISIGGKTEIKYSVEDINRLIKSARDVRANIISI